MFLSNGLMHVMFQRHNTYVLRYFACEALCLVNIIVQLYLMDAFFDGEFLQYGLRVMRFADSTQEERVDPMVRASRDSNREMNS